MNPKLTSQLKTTVRMYWYDNVMKAALWLFISFLWGFSCTFVIPQKGVKGHGKEGFLSMPPKELWGTNGLVSRTLVYWKNCIMFNFIGRLRSDLKKEKEKKNVL